MSATERHATPRSLSEREHLLDAMVYVSAVERGDRAPAQAIAERRGISRRTAQGRIVRAEAYGLLTPVERQGCKNRQLTPRARECIASLGMEFRLIAALDPSPSVTFVGEGWSARLEGSSEVDGPTSLTIYSTGDAPTTITSGVLRSVPLNDARKVLRRLRADALATQDSQEEGVYQLPGRMVTEADWIKFARAYACAKTQNPHQPIVHLARATGLSPNTISARIRRVQELGLLS